MVEVKKIISVKLSILVLFATLRLYAQGVADSSEGSFEIALNPKKVAEMMLSQSLRSQEIDAQFQQYRLQAVQPLAEFDWKSRIETGYEFDRSESLSSSLSGVKFERYKTSVGFGKSFLTGTDLLAEFARLSQKADLEGLTSTSIKDKQTQDTFSLQIEQSLLNNFFGYADRAKIRAAQTTYESQILLRSDELQNLVLTGIRQFWDTYVAQENFREALASRDLYKKLVDSVRRKNSFGYTNPGEFSQVQAEYEGQEQKVKLASQNYLKQLEDLLSTLNLPANATVKFDVPTSLPAVPELDKKDLLSLRAIRSQKLKVQAAEELLRSSKSGRYPELFLVGQVSTSGVEESAEASYTEAINGTRPKYYVGMKFQYAFGSGSQTEDIFNKKMSLQQEKLKLDRQTRELFNKEQQAIRNVQATFALAQSIGQQRIMREKAVQELNRSFNQGRSDISVLIEAMNKYFASEVDYTKAVGQYHVALNEWAAARDELIPDEGKK